MAADAPAEVAVICQCVTVSVSVAYVYIYMCVASIQESGIGETGWGVQRWW